MVKYGKRMKLMWLLCFINYDIKRIELQDRIFDVILVFFVRIRFFMQHALPCAQVSIMNEERLIQREYDPVTGLHTLTGFFSFLRSIPAAQDKSGAVIFLDILNFKDFNQRYGFASGDDLLRGVAHEITRLFPECVACRSSADHFIIFLHLETEEVVRDLLEQLQESIRQYEKGIRLTLKAGIYFSDGTEPDPAFATDYSKIACTHAKQSFDQDIFIYDQTLAKKEAFHQYVMAGFPEALEKGYIKTYYQREVRALTGQNCGYEALARWEDPEYAFGLTHVAHDDGSTTVSQNLLQSGQSTADTGVVSNLSVLVQGHVEVNAHDCLLTGKVEFVDCHDDLQFNNLY